MNDPIHHFHRRALLAGALAALFAPGARAAAKAAGIAMPTRIVCAGGAVTETLYALGEGGRIAGVDSTSLFPAEALRDKPNVGYLRALSAEGILSLAPDLVLAAADAGPPDALRLVSEAGVPVRMVAGDLTPEGVMTRIATIGAIVGAQDKATALASRIEAGFDTLARARAAIAQPRKVLFVLALREGRPMVGGRGSAADAMIALAGGVNAAAGIEGYKPMAEEAVIAAAPDAIAMMDRGAHAVSADELFVQPAFAQTPAAARRALITMDGLYLLGFGPRTADAARDLMVALYPDMSGTTRR